MYTWLQFLVLHSIQTQFNNNMAGSQNDITNIAKTVCHFIGNPEFLVWAN